jgi:hypothetical protein
MRRRIRRLLTGVVGLFASTHEERVAGLVLVDARHEDYGQRLAN